MRSCCENICKANDSIPCHETQSLFRWVNLFFVIIGMGPSRPNLGLELALPKL